LRRAHLAAPVRDRGSIDLNFRGILIPLERRSRSAYKLLLAELAPTADTTDRKSRFGCFLDCRRRSS